MYQKTSVCACLVRQKHECVRVRGSCVSGASVRACEFCIWAFGDGVDCNLKCKSLFENEGQISMDRAFKKKENDGQMATDRAFLCGCVCVHVRPVSLTKSTPAHTHSLSSIILSTHPYIHCGQCHFHFLPTVQESPPPAAISPRDVS